MQKDFAKQVFLMTVSSQEANMMHHNRTYTTILVVQVLGKQNNDRERCKGMMPKNSKRKDNIADVKDGERNGA